MLEALTTNTEPNKNPMISPIINFLMFSPF